jgi:hypothetical protein
MTIDLDKIRVLTVLTDDGMTLVFVKEQMALGSYYYRYQESAHFNVFVIPEFSAIHTFSTDATYLWLVNNKFTVIENVEL